MNEVADLIKRAIELGNMAQAQTQFPQTQYEMFGSAILLLREAQERIPYREYKEQLSNIIMALADQRSQALQGYTTFWGQLKPRLWAIARDLLDIATFGALPGEVGEPGELAPDYAKGGIGGSFAIPSGDAERIVREFGGTLEDEISKIPEKVGDWWDKFLEWLKGNWGTIALALVALAVLVVYFV